jgi:hypothetical protein
MQSRFAIHAKIAISPPVLEHVRRRGAPELSPYARPNADRPATDLALGAKPFASARRNRNVAMVRAIVNLAKDLGIADSGAESTLAAATRDAAAPLREPALRHLPCAQCAVVFPEPAAHPERIADA